MHVKPLHEDNNQNYIENIYIYLYNLYMYINNIYVYLLYTYIYNKKFFKIISLIFRS